MSEQNESKRVAKATVSVEGTVLTFAYGNGDVRTYDIGTLSDEMKLRLAVHGAEQKLRDSYAAKTITAEQAVGVNAKIWDSLLANQFTVRGEGGGAETSIELLARAMVNAWANKGVEKDYSAVLAMVQGYTKEERANVRSRESVAIELAKLRAKDTVVPEGSEDL
jgi:hypothetical protein